MECSGGYPPLRETRWFATAEEAKATAEGEYVAWAIEDNEWSAKNGVQSRYQRQTTPTWDTADGDLPWLQFGSDFGYVVIEVPTA